MTVSHDVAAAGSRNGLGAGRGVDDLAFVVIGTGIAATLVTGGVLVRGGSSKAGELGHVIVRSDGPPCACGQRGCLEAISSARAIADAYAARSGRTVDGAAQRSPPAWASIPWPRRCGRTRSTPSQTRC